MRWQQEEKNMQAIRYHSKKGYVHGLMVGETKKYIRLILMDSPIRMRRYPIDEKNFIEPLAYKPARAAKLLRQAARQWHHKLNKPTREALRRAT